MNKVDWNTVQATLWVLVGSVVVASIIVRIITWGRL